MEEKTVLPHSKIPINKCRRHNRNGKIMICAYTYKKDIW